MKLLLSTLTLLLSTLYSSAQLAIPFSAASNGQTFSTCNGFIIDSGGQGGSGYSDGEDITITLCPDTPGEIISVVFNLFDLDLTDDNPGPPTNVDYMSVYDGTSTAANSLGVYSGAQLQGVVIQSTVLNPSGCITLKFTSNSTGTGMFSASVSCETPCSNPQAGGIVLGGITTDSIRVCIGETVNFQEQGSFAQPGFNLVDYSWDFMDGTIGNGQNVSHSFSQAGLYKVQLFVTDDNGCDNPNLIDLQVLVATYPTFQNFPQDTSICLGESMNFIADPANYPLEWNGFPGSTTIDDGCISDSFLGISQDVDLMQTGFSSGTNIENVNDITSICFDFEHTFMGDLVIMLTCPNGQNVIMHQQGGSGTELGVPIQEDNVDCSDPATMGTPFNYCFTPNATDTWVEWVDNQGGAGLTLPAGDYASVQPLSNLVGCPTNGVWTLSIIDNWASDDGTVFGFSITLDSSYYPPVSSFTPTIGVGLDSSFWVNPVYQTALSANGNDLTVTPTVGGTFPYTYEVTNNFGCTHDSTVMLTVDPLVNVNAGNDTTLCSGNGLQLNGQLIGYNSDCNYTLSLDDTFGDGWNGAVLTVTVNGISSNYTMATGSNKIENLQIPNGANVSVTITNQGSYYDELSYTITDENGATVLTQGPAINGNPTDNFVSNCPPDYIYTWTPATNLNDATILDPFLNVSGQETLILSTYPVGHPVCATQDTIVVSLSATPDPGVDATIQVCNPASPVDLFPNLGPTASPNGTWTDPNGSPTVMPFDPQNMPYGNYVYTADSNGCSDQATITVNEIFADITATLVNDALCFDSINGSITINGVNFDSYSVDTGTPITSGSPFTVNNLHAGSYLITVTSAEGCIDTATVMVNEPTSLATSTVQTNASCFGVCDGELQSTANGGTAPYNYTWTTGVIGNQNGFADALCAGNDSIIITDDHGCLIIEPFTITEPAEVIVGLAGDTLSGCFPHNVNFTNTTSSNDIDFTVVDFGDGIENTFSGIDDFSHTYDSPGTYDVTITVTTVFGCTYTITYNSLIVVHNNPTASFLFSPLKITSLNPIVQFTDGSSFDVTSWTWDLPGATPNNAYSQNVNDVIYPQGEVGTYPVTLIVENGFGCVDTTERIVQIINDVLIFAPNTFTPDGDEFNQNWYVSVSGIDIYDFDLRIFNRWGEVVWESHDPSVGWDGTYKGKVLQQGTYQWVIKCADAVDDNKYTFNGHVTIIK